MFYRCVCVCVRYSEKWQEGKYFLEYCILEESPRSQDIIRQIMREALRRCTGRARLLFVVYWPGYNSIRVGF